ncbi:MAG TPA: ATP-binding protein [Leptolyngbyaceae cyanobacterium]
MSFPNSPTSLEALGPNPNHRNHTIGLILGLFTTVLLLEALSPADYVFSYLYAGPILLANFRLRPKIGVWLTLLAGLLTMAGLWNASSAVSFLPTLENRLIAVAALVVTEILSYQNQHYGKALAQQQAKLQIQEKLGRLREDFVATLTHDLKTPLLGAIETLKVFQAEEFGQVSPCQQKVLATMTRSHQSSLQLLETLLDVYRNDTDGIQLELAQVNLVEIAKQVVESLSNLASNYRVAIKLKQEELFGRSCHVVGDELQLRRVFSNLLINAINHSPIDSEVEIRIRIQLKSLGYRALVEVVDQGPGIREEDLSQIFEQFYQGGSTRQAKGSGLGLYLSRQIIEAHEGTIWAKNRNSQAGAIFGFSLPTRSI